VVNLFVATFVKILKDTFNKQIGLYCWRTFASFFLGNKIIVPKFRRFSCREPGGNPQTEPWGRVLLDPRRPNKTLMGNHLGQVPCYVPFGKLRPSLRILENHMLKIHSLVQIPMGYPRFVSHRAQYYGYLMDRIGFYNNWLYASWAKLWLSFFLGEERWQLEIDLFSGCPS
jgi:hypothetical protein